MKKKIGIAYFVVLFIVVLLMVGYMVVIKNSYNNQLNYLTEEIVFLKSKVSEAEIESARINQELDHLKTSDEERVALALSMKEFLNTSLNFENNASELGYVTRQSMDGQYTIESALVNQKRISEFLDSFLELTDRFRKQLSTEEIQTIGNLDWETQYIGFKNIVTGNDIAFHEMEFIIKKLDFQLAICLFEKGDMDFADLLSKKDAYSSAKEEFELFITHVKLVD